MQQIYTTVTSMTVFLQLLLVTIPFSLAFSPFFDKDFRTSVALRMGTTTDSHQTNHHNDDNVAHSHKIKAILWDMDETVIATELLSDKAILSVLNPKGITAVPWEIKKPTLGLRGADWIPMVLG